jgi:hypothetical protein
MNIYLPRFIEQKEPFGLHYPAAILEAKYKVQICRNHEYVISEPLGPGFHKNLITNAGLDALMTGTNLAALISTAARVGSGTNPPANTDTALQTFLKGTVTAFTGGGIQAVNDTVNGAVAFTMVWEFAAEVGSVTYNELGLASQFSVGGTQYTRALFGSPVSLTAGQNLRLTYVLNISQPATVTPITVSLAAVNGFNISGQMKAVGTFGNLFGTASSGGITAANDVSWRCSLGGGGTVCVMCSAPTTFPTVNTALSITQITTSTVSSPTLSTYTNGSFTRTATYVWSPSTPPSTVSNVNGLDFCLNTNTAAGIYLLLTSAQTKANTNTLTVVLSSSVARA